MPSGASRWGYVEQYYEPFQIAEYCPVNVVVLWLRGSSLFHLPLSYSSKLHKHGSEKRPSADLEWAKLSIKDGLRIIRSQRLFIKKLLEFSIERNKGVKRSLFELNSTSRVFLDVTKASFLNSTSNIHGKQLSSYSSLYWKVTYE